MCITKYSVCQVISTVSSDFPLIASSHCPFLDSTIIAFHAGCSEKEHTFYLPRVLTFAEYWTTYARQGMKVPILSSDAYMLGEGANMCEMRERYLYPSDGSIIKYSEEGIISIMKVCVNFVKDFVWSLPFFSNMLCN